MSFASKSWVRRMRRENWVEDRNTSLIPGGFSPFQSGPTTRKSPASGPVARVPM
jgi:hypothetical protein